jgi:lysophospholipase L1-like esterase
MPFARLASKRILACGLAVLGLAVPRSRARAETATPAVAAAAESPAARRLEEWRRGRIHVYLNDFGELARYRAANAKLNPPATGENRVVFFGDSITDIWALASAFPGKPYVNRGIGGQTTAQMLVRFRQDVIALAPKVVVILAGTNDIAGNTGPASLDEIEANLATMVELARAHGIRVVLSSVTPVHSYTPASEITFPLRPPERIAALNAWIKRYAAETGSVYLDYWSAMVDGQGLLKRELAEDGLHPTKAGFAVMAPLAQRAIDRALAGR